MWVGNLSFTLALLGVPVESAIRLKSRGIAGLLFSLLPRSHVFFGTEVECVLAILNTRLAPFDWRPD